MKTSTPTPETPPAPQSPPTPRNGDDYTPTFPAAAPQKPASSQHLSKDAERMSEGKDFSTLESREKPPFPVQSGRG